MTDTWRPPGASNHPAWIAISALLLAMSNRVANKSPENVAAEQVAIRTVNDVLAALGSPTPQETATALKQGFDTACTSGGIGR